MTDRPIPLRAARRALHLLPPAAQSRVRVIAKRLGALPMQGDGERTNQPRLPAGFAIVFDADYYVASGADVPRGTCPLDHFRSGGWRAGVNPNPLFDVDWYVARYGGPEAFDESDPLTVYLTDGWIRGHDPSPWFSTRYYLDESRRLGLGDVNPLVHYLSIGCTEGRLVSDRHATHMRTVESNWSRATADLFVELNRPGEDPFEVPLTALTDAPYGLVTFDLWDTLIGRTRPADAAKLATARRLALSIRQPQRTWELFEARVEIERAQAAANAHEEYHAVDVLAELIGEVGEVGDPDVAARLARDLVDLEVADEAHETHRIVPIADTLAALQATGATRTAVLSDFYLGADDLGVLLTANGIDVAGTAVLVSCDLGASKRLGDVYARVHEQFGVAPHEHLHIGDNRHSDVEQANRSGAHAALVKHSHSDWPPPGTFSREHMSSWPHDVRRDVEQLLRATANAHRDPWRTRRAKLAAAPVAVLAVTHVAAAIEAARSRSVDVVHYVSREGAFLSRVHREVADIVGDGEAPRAVHLELSRRATFGPSLGRLDRAALDRVLSQYPNQSVHGLLTSLGVDPATLAREIASLPVDPVEVIHVAESLPVLEFLERPEVVATIEARWAEQRGLLRRYLDSREFGSSAVIGDVGWRGTIQDNLCRILPDRHIHGVYLGLFPYLNPQPSNATKQAVAFDGNRGHEFGFADPPAIIESPMTPPIPTTVAFRAVGERVEPVRVDESGRAESLISSLQDAVVEVAPVVARRLVAFGGSSDLLRPGLGHFLAALYDEPPGGLVDVWFDSAHDDTFGAGNDTPYKKQPITAGLLSSPTPTILLPEAAASRWPRGYVRWAPVDAADGLRWLIGTDPDD